MKKGKKYQDSVKLIEKGQLYDPAEARDLVCKTATAKFDETVEVHIRTGCDGRHAEQQIRGAVVLPNGTGKTVKVLVFAKGAKLDEALAAGADYLLRHMLQQASLGLFTWWWSSKRGRTIASRPLKAKASTAFCRPVQG